MCCAASWFKFITNHAKQRHHKQLNLGLTRNRYFAFYAFEEKDNINFVPENVATVVCEVSL